MKPKHFCLLFLLIPALTLAQQPASTSSADTPQAIHDSAIVIDTHADTPQRFLDENFDLGQNTPVSAGHMDLVKIKARNLGPEFSPVWLEPDSQTHHPKP